MFQPSLVNNAKPKLRVEGGDCLDCEKECINAATQEQAKIGDRGGRLGTPSGSVIYL
jgi:hypothetical protein